MASAFWKNRIFVAGVFWHKERNILEYILKAMLQQMPCNLDNDSTHLLIQQVCEKRELYNVYVSEMLRDESVSGILSCKRKTCCRAQCFVGFSRGVPNLEQLDFKLLLFHKRKKQWLF